MHCDLLIENASPLITIASPNGPKRGSAMRDLGIIENGTVAISAGQIVAVGTSDELAHVISKQRIDANGQAVLPGFVDAHTHAVFAGDRVNEFEQRLAGASYLEIMAAGGGIMSTVNATRQASLEQLVSESAERLRVMLHYGTTTVEVKTGYGLNTADELKMLDAIHQLSDQSIEIVPTFLGAHATPSEYTGRDDEYIELVISEMLPAVQQWAAHHSWPLPFVDVFCDQGAFTLPQLQRLLQAAKAQGFPLKAHLDEFASLGGTPAAAALGACSVDHMIASGDEDLAALQANPNTIATLMPATPFGLGLGHYAPARRMLDEFGLAIALGSDLNPGTCWCVSMPFVMALACRGMGLTPAEALVGATLNAAYAIGCGERIGSIEPGKQADLLILRHHDYRQLSYRIGENLVQSIIKRGQIVAL